jgi:hypothetical protein
MPRPVQHPRQAPRGTAGNVACRPLLPLSTSGKHVPVTCRGTGAAGTWPRSCSARPGMGRPPCSPWPGQPSTPANRRSTDRGRPGKTLAVICVRHAEGSRGQECRVAVTERVNLTESLTEVPGGGVSQGFRKSPRVPVSEPLPGAGQAMAPVWTAVTEQPGRQLAGLPHTRSLASSLTQRGRVAAMPGSGVSRDSWRLPR